MVPRMVVQAKDAADRPDKPGLVNRLGDAIEVEANEVFAHPELHSVFVRLLHHVAGLPQRAGNAGFDQVVDAGPGEGYGDGVVHVDRCHHQGRLHQVGPNQFVQGIERVCVNRIRVAVRMLLDRITDGHHVYPGAQALEQALIDGRGAVARSNHGDVNRSVGCHHGKPPWPAWIGLGPLFRQPPDRVAGWDG